MTQSDTPVVFALALTFLLLVGAASDSHWSPFEAEQESGGPAEPTVVTVPVPTLQQIEPKVVLGPEPAEPRKPRVRIVRQKTRQVVVPGEGTDTRTVIRETVVRPAPRSRPEPSPTPPSQDPPPSDPPEDPDDEEPGAKVCIAGVCIDAGQSTTRGNR